MSKVRFKQPCSDCPFRREATPGWTGGAAPEWFTDGAVADNAVYSPGDTTGPQPQGGLMPCHQTVDYTDPDWAENQLDDASACAGALAHAANRFKLPRHPARAAAVGEVGQREDVFRSADEMIAHHRQPGSMRSWERDDG